MSGHRPAGSGRQRVVYSRRGKRRLVKAYLLGLVTVLLPEALVAAVVFWPPTSAVAGHPQPVIVPPPSPVVAAPTQAPPETTTTTSPVPPVAPASTPESSAPETPAAVPVQAPGTVRLPSGSTAVLVRQEVVGGVLPVPQSLGQAAWWGADFDANRGASVLAGHVNWGGRIGPFAELWRARIAQEIHVVDPSGRTAVYRISQLITLHKDELPQRAAELFGQTGAHRLVLVTCGG
ncbi:class F sortase, partial [Amycolatopsis rhizosphaerae]